MQKTLSALVALISLLAVNLRPTQAQSGSGQAVEPSETPQAINERVDGAAARRNAAPATPQDVKGTIRVSADETREDVVARDKPLVLAGRVTRDVLAINSDVTIERGAKVGGSVVAIGGSVNNKAGASVQVVQQNPGLLPLLSLNFPEQTVLPAPAAPHIVFAEPPHPKKDDWFGGQVAILALGLISGLILLVVAPRATHQVTARVTLEPARCLVVGGLTAVGLLVVQVFNGALLHSPLSLLWAPFAFLVVLASAFLLLCGWLCAMRYVGDCVARKTGRFTQSGLYGRMALGLVAFFVLNTCLGLLNPNLTGVGTLMEFFAALMGLGAICVTGFGSDPEWLSARLHGKTGWFRR